MPHPTGRAAMRMLEGEGFSNDGYIDIFDGGPTMAAHTDQIRTVRDAKDAALVATDLATGRSGLVARGTLGDFVCVRAQIEERDDGIAIDAEAARLLGAAHGDTLVYIAR
jgi:arginine N-succinyltransferase